MKCNKTIIIIYDAEKWLYVGYYDWLIVLNKLMGHLSIMKFYTPGGGGGDQGYPSDWLPTSTITL